jgi:hypothetical protein
LHRYAVTLGIITVALLSGCASTKQAADVRPSGFLADARALRLQAAITHGKVSRTALVHHTRADTEWAQAP